VRWWALWIRYLRLGLRLRETAGDYWSRWLLAYLGATTVFRSSRIGLPGSVGLRVRLGGVVYPIRLKSMTELDVLREIGVDDEYGAADALPARTIVDLGANVGLATLRLLASHPGAHVLAVEADPALIARLRRNVEGLPVTVVHAAVCAESGEQAFYTSRSSSWTNSLDRNHPSQTAVRVRALTLEELLESNDLDRVDLLKLDVEGAEWEILQGGVPPGIAAIVGEAHGNAGRSPKAFIDMLARTMRVRTTWVGDDQATFVATREGSRQPGR
jgi:FkbM family methyltransferase